jgi:hypothetical protein
MYPVFNEHEQKVLRFLKSEFLEKGERPATMHDRGTVHPDVMTKFNLSSSEYRELIRQFEALGIVDFNPHAIESPNGLLHIKPYVVELVRQLDEEALRNKAQPPPNKLDQAKQWAFSKWWFVAVVIGLAVVTALALFIGNPNTILDHFGIKMKR